MQVINAVAQFEPGLLIWCTHAGLRRATAAGKEFGRPSALRKHSASSSRGTWTPESPSSDCARHEDEQADDHAGAAGTGGAAGYLRVTLPIRLNAIAEAVSCSAHRMIRWSSDSCQRLANKV